MGSSKAPDSIFVIVSGKEIRSKLSHPAKENFFTVVGPVLGRETKANFLQDQNASSPTSVTVSGTCMPFNDTQLKKALSPILSNDDK